MFLQRKPSVHLLLIVATLDSNCRNLPNKSEVLKPVSVYMFNCEVVENYSLNMSWRELCVTLVTLATQGYMCRSHVQLS